MAAGGGGGVAAALVLTDKQDSVSGKPQDCQPQSPKRITSRRRKAGQCLGGGGGDGGESFIKIAPHGLFMDAGAAAAAVEGCRSSVFHCFHKCIHTVNIYTFICIFVCAGKKEKTKRASL